MRRRGRRKGVVIIPKQLVKGSYSAVGKRGLSTCSMEGGHRPIIDGDMSDVAMWQQSDGPSERRLGA